MTLLAKTYQILFLITLVHSSYAYANVIVDKTVIEQRIEELSNQSPDSPNDALIELDQMIASAKSNNWPLVLNNAVAIKVDILVSLERLTEAKVLIDEYLPIARIQGYEDTVLSLELAEILVITSNAPYVVVSEKESLLLEKANQLERAGDGNKEDIGQIYFNVGLSQSTNENMQGAFINLKKSYEIFSELGDKEQLSGVLTALGSVYVYLGSVRLGIEYMNESLTLGAELHSELDESIIRYNIGMAHESIDEHKQAIIHLERSMLLSQKIGDDVGVAWAKSTLADIYLIENNTDKAQAYYQAGVEVFAASGDHRSHTQSLIGLAKTQLKNNKPEIAKKHLDQAEQYISKIESKSLSGFYLKTLANYYSVIGDFKLAYDTQRKYTEQEIEIYKEEKKTNTDKLRVQFDAELKENENKILLKQNELNNLKIAKQEEEKNYLVWIAVLAAMVICIVIFMLFKQIQHRDRFKKMALRDHLTNSPNRRAILQYAQERFNEAEYTGMELSIGIIDLDFFKKVNDNYGHDAGDAVLVAFADACKVTFRRQDRYGRYGGEEWLVVLSDTRRENLEQIFSRLNEQLNKSRISGIPNGKQITFSMGVAQYKADIDQSLQILINRADDNLYQAKGKGRNQLVM